MSMTDADYMNYLIHLGKIGKNPTKGDLCSQYSTYRQLVALWWRALSDQDLINLFKGVVIIEEFLLQKGEKIGSCTQTKELYSEIRSRHLDDDYCIGNWAFIYSSNPYVPLDTGNRHGATTIFEYLDWEREFVKRTNLEQEKTIKGKEEKKRLKAEAYEKRLKEKEKRDRCLGYIK